MTDTVLDRGSDSLNYAVQIQGWYAYIDGGDYAEEQQEKLADALMSAQQDEFNALLPAGCYWHPHTSEITGPVGTSLEEALAEHGTGHHDSAVGDAMELAGDRVAARFAEIEREALGQ